MKKIFLLVAVLGLVACSERGQVPASERTYQGKADTKPWDNDGSWTRGNRESWEEAIKTRQLAQHEHRRIYQ